MLKRELELLFDVVPNFKGKLLEKLKSYECRDISNDIREWCIKVLGKKMEVELIEDGACEKYLESIGVNVNDLEEIKNFKFSIKEKESFYSTFYYYITENIFELYLQTIGYNDLIISQISNLVQAELKVNISSKDEEVYRRGICSGCEKQWGMCSCDNNPFSPKCSPKYMTAGFPHNEPIELFCYRKRKLESPKTANYSPQKVDELIFLGEDVRRKTVILAGKDSCIVSDMGNRLFNQDSAIVIRHPKIPEFKLIAVADGMGGKESGEKFSSKTIEKLKSWFNSFPVSDEIYTNDEYHRIVLGSLKKCIANIDKELRQELKGIDGGTTLAAAVICGTHTILLNIGDSRIYNYKDGELKLLTKDQSLVWSGRDDVDTNRFNKKSHYITNFLPANDITCFRSNDKYLYIPTNRLGYLVLCTDGVSDMLSQSTMGNLVTQNQESIEGVASRLVEYAVTNDSYLDLTTVSSPNKYYDMLPAGKDNATAAIARVRRGKI